MTPQFDVAVIGGGIVGLAHAWMAARRKLRVLLCERTAVACGASVRNFGMFWPVGQPAGELFQTALRSRELWLELHAAGVIAAEACGSIHLAHRPDELAVLEEFCQAKSHDLRMITAAEVLEIAPLANNKGLLAGMYSGSEMRVNPRVASAEIAAYLRERLGVETQFSTAISQIDQGMLVASDGRRFHADRIVVCGGSDLQTLYPEMFEESGLVLCKLQMLRLAAPPPARMLPHLASGLTLRHYQSFQRCPSWATLVARIERETPELNRFGIHIMASQFPNGDIILGDSHEYGNDITPFDKFEIDDLILRETRKVFQVDERGLNQRWNGIYAKHRQQPAFEATAKDGVHVFTGLGGAGMTMSFGLAEQAWERWGASR